MKVVSLFLLPLLTIAHDFTNCKDNTILNVQSILLNPDPPVIGQNLDINIKGISSKIISSASTTLTIKSFGIQVLQKYFDLCSITSCPIPENQLSNINISENIPSEIPAGITLNVELVSKTDVDEIACIDLSFKLSKNYLN